MGSNPTLSANSIAPGQGAVFKEHTVATVLITGCNRGIGLELAKQLKERGDDVIAVCRQSGAELAGLGVRVIDGIDVSAADDVSRLPAFCQVPVFT